MSSALEARYITVHRGTAVAYSNRTQVLERLQSTKRWFVIVGVSASLFSTFITSIIETVTTRPTVVPAWEVRRDGR